MARGQLTQRPVEPPDVEFEIATLLGDIATFDTIVEPAVPDFTPGTYQFTDGTADLASSGAGNGAVVTIVVDSLNGAGTQGGITTVFNQTAYDYYEVGTYPDTDVTLSGAIDGTGANAEVIVDGTGIYTITNIVHGSDHSANMVFYDVPLGGGTGTGAEATVTVDVNGDVTSVIITQPGTGYLITDTLLTISNAIIGGAANATVDVQKLAGRISAITITDAGSDYDVGETLSVELAVGVLGGSLIGWGDYNPVKDYAALDIIRPNSNNAGGYFYQLTTDGTGASVEPAAWNQVEGGTTTDASGNIWTNVGSVDTCDVNTLDGSISTVTILTTSRGEGYAINDTFTITQTSIGGDSTTPTFDVATLYGGVSNADNTTVTITSGGADWLVGDTLSTSELTRINGVGTGLALVVDTIDGNGAITAVRVTSTGVGYVIGDDIAYSGLEAGVSSTDYYNHHQYELGGIIEEYVDSGTGLQVGFTVASLLVSSDASTWIVSAGGRGYQVGDKIYVTSDSLVSFVVTSVNSGVVTGIALVDGISTQGDGAKVNQATTLVSKNTSAPAGTQVHSNVANDPSIKLVVPADQPQLKIQKRTVSGVTVYAEPTTLDSYGQVVGNTLRAEDILDEDRCVASGFTWTKTTAVAGNRSSFGYCHETVSFVNTLREERCLMSGGFVDRAVTQGNAGCCVDKATAGTWRTYVDTKYNGGTPSAADVTRYSKLYGNNWVEALCRLGGQYWDGNNCIAMPVAATFAGYNQADCATNKGVWVAGVCYAPTTFGNGNGGSYNQKTKTTVVKPL